MACPTCKGRGDVPWNPEGRPLPDATVTLIGGVILFALGGFLLTAYGHGWLGYTGCLFMAFVGLIVIIVSYGSNHG